jgi:hypothetical protein
MVSISIVSHAQGGLVGALLADLNRIFGFEEFEVLLVVNIPEKLLFTSSDFPFVLKIIKNSTPKGFSENHNHAFSLSSGKYFCVINPDIRLTSNPFTPLMLLLQDTSIGLAAPLVISPTGTIEDSARTFPTPLTILCKVFGGCRKGSYLIQESPIFPDWVGGMFMLFPREVYEVLGGFDDHYFLYYEDVDICARLSLTGRKVVLSPAAVVVHHAQRSSRRRLTFAGWHLRSMLRFFISTVCWRVQLRALFRKISGKLSLNLSQGGR